MSERVPVLTRTRQEQEAVTSHLKSTGGAWISMPPDYETFSQAELSKKLEQVRKAIVSETESDPSEVQHAYEQSQHFIDSSFEFYEGKKDLGRIGRAFVVPMRSDRLDDNYASESLPFYPLLDPSRFGVTSEVRMRTMYGLPPTILDTNKKTNDSIYDGALVLAPLYVDMSKDIWNDASDINQAVELARVVDRMLHETAHFVHKRLGAQYAGLGAILPHPTLTNFGRKLRAVPGMEKLVTTTGHGGTVYMIAKTAISALEKSSVESHGRIGVLGGAGSIGWSSIQALRDMIPDHNVHAFDKREQRMSDLLNGAPDLGRVAIAGSVADVLMRNKVIVSAITEKIDLNDRLYRDIDLDGVLVIDDGQPGSFDRDQLEARGGKLLWVAGKDASPTGFMTKDGYYTNGTGYNYGDASGLYGATTEFGCGLEAAVVAASQNPDNAVSGPVLIDDVRRIGRLFDEYGVDLAPYQSFGRPVDIR